MEQHVPAYLAVIRLQSSTSLNIVCVWRMLRFYHPAKNYILYRLRASRYGCRRTLVCGIVGGGHLAWVVSLLMLGEGPDGELGLNVSHMWLYRFVV